MMSFGTDLQGWQSHEALLNIQDYEISLFEAMRKCIAHRSKCERDYSNSLSSVIHSATQKLYDDESDFDTPMSKVPVLDVEHRGTLFLSVLSVYS